MNDQLTNNPEALRLFFTDDIYLVSEKGGLSDNSNELQELQAARLNNPVVAEEIIIAFKEVEVVTAIEVISVNEPEILPKEQAKQEIQLNPLSTKDDQDSKPGQAILLNIVDAEDNQALNQNQATQSIAFKYMGNNQKKVLILVNDPGYEVSTELGRDILRNLVNAINLKTNDFALVNYAQYAGSTFSDLQKFFSSNLMLIFGIEPLQLSLPDFPKNIKVSQEEITLIFTANLNNLNDDPQGKKMLWNSLKQLTI